MAAPIVRVTSDRLPQVVSMSARAFIDEAMFRWVLGEVDDPLSAIEAEFAAMHAVTSDLGCLWEAGEALGAAGWVSPEASPVYWERCKAFTSEGAGLAAYATDGGRRYEMLYECLDSHEPSEPVWTLDTLHGRADPAARRHRLGVDRARSGTRARIAVRIVPRYEQTGAGWLLRSVRVRRHQRN